MHSTRESSQFSTRRSYPLLKFFDAATLVALQCGSMTHKGMAFLMEEGEQEEYGVEECKRILKICSRLPHIQSSGFNFDSRMAHRYITCIKRATRKAVWDIICPEWFIDVDKKIFYPLSKTPNS